MITAKQQKLKEELKKKHQNKKNQPNKQAKQAKQLKEQISENPDICEADCICDDIKAKYDNENTKKTVSKMPFTFSQNPLANAMLAGDILSTPAFRKNYKR